MVVIFAKLFDPWTERHMIPYTVILFQAPVKIMYLLVCWATQRGNSWYFKGKKEKSPLQVLISVFSVKQEPRDQENSSELVTVNFDKWE